MSKINPYEFIPLPEKVYYPDQKLPYHYQYDVNLNTGYIEYSFKNESHLIIGDGKSGERKEKIEEFFLINDIPVIPGSSMRGKVRVNAEILSCAYPRFIDDTPNERHKTNPQAEIEKMLGERKNYDCVDLLFGFVESDFEIESKDSYKGRISFLDAKCSSDINEGSYFITKRMKLLSPQSEANSYYQKSGELKGAYKYYPAHSHNKNLKTATTMRSGNKDENMENRLKLLKPNKKFTGKIFFENLTDFELGLLLTSLQYDKDIIDSVGMGKSIGYGKIKMIELKLYLDDENRFKDLDYSTSNCSGQIEALKKGFVEDMKRNYAGDYDKVVEAYKKSKYKSSSQRKHVPK